MNLLVEEGTFAVCKLTADHPVDLSALKGFYSLTRTSDELSLVCRADSVPSASAENVVIQCEKDWKCLKVQGPLDFGLTGVLSSLSSPLADAGVAIFVVSTFDTDYLLVKADKLDLAMETLQAKGHVVVVVQHEGQENKKIKPDDGPAVAFDVDPLADMVRNHDKYPPSPMFLLFVGSGWPPDASQLAGPYDNFRQAVKSCWDPSDLNPNDPACHFYPFRTLHVTVLTLYRKPEVPSKQQQDAMVEAWRQVFRTATEMPLWPKQPLKLKIESSQIGARAGILLWRERTGGMEAMRQCFRVASEQHKDRLARAGITLDMINIPPIVHSTFLRFLRPPSTPGQVVQERFANRVLPNLADVFPNEMEVPIVKFLCERTPYMNIPHDSDHVFSTSFLTTNAQDRYMEDCDMAQQRYTDILEERLVKRSHT